MGSSPDDPLYHRLPGTARITLGIGAVGASSSRTSTGRNTGFTSTTETDANRGAFSHLKIRLAFSACPCATETPGPLVSPQIERFSSALQRRYLRRLGIAPGNRMSPLPSG